VDLVFAKLHVSGVPALGAGIHARLTLSDTRGTVGHAGLAVGAEPVVVATQEAPLLAGMFRFLKPPLVEAPILGGAATFPEALQIPGATLAMCLATSHIAPCPFRVSIHAGVPGALDLVATGLLWVTQLSVYRRIQKVRGVWQLGPDEGLNACIWEVRVVWQLGPDEGLNACIWEVRVVWQLGPDEGLNACIWEVRVVWQLGPDEGLNACIWEVRVVWQLGPDEGLCVQSIVHYMRRADVVYPNPNPNPNPNPDPNPNFVTLTLPPTQS
jgi:hypothetical protein